MNEIEKIKEIPEEFSAMPEIGKAIELTQEASFSPAELAEYDGYWDQVRIEKTIKSDARREGKIEGKTEIALKMLAKNKEDAEILELTGLTLSELNELKNRS